MCQLVLYKSISIRYLNKADKLTNTLLHSTHGSGRFVKSITFCNGFEIPVANLKHIDPSKDLLHLLLIKCPHVEEVHLSTQLSSHTQIEYFYTALKRTRTWKLRVIPDIFMSHDNINVYNRFADLMVDSLAHIEVEKWNNDYEINYTYLKGYPKLLSVKIKHYDCAFITDCLQVVRNIPLLESLHLDYAGEEPTLLDWDNDMLNIKPLSNIKKLHLNGFAPFNENELLFIMDKFTHVVDLSISTNQRDWIDEEEFSSSIMLDFIGYFKKIPKCSISIIHYKHLELHKHYYDATENRTLTLVFVNQRNGISNIILSYNGNELTLTAKYPRQQHHMNRFNSSIVYMDEVRDHIQNLGIKFDKDFDIINDYLDYAFANCRQLRRLEISQGILKSSPFDMTTNIYRSISHLVLRQVKLYENALRYLSKALPHLESMKLEDCQFFGHTDSSSPGVISDSNNEDADEDVLMTEHSGYNQYDTVEVLSMHSSQNA